MAIETKPKIKETPTRTAPLRLQGSVKEAFLITNDGLYELGGSDALELEQKIKNDESHIPSDYKHFDNDKHLWAYWAVEDSEGDISPYTLPDSQDYSTTSPQLYTKAVVFPQVIARIAKKLKETPLSMWDKMLKPATILLAIVGIILAIAIFMVAAQG